MLKNSFWRLVTRFVSIFFAMFSSIIINRTLGPENKGHYAIMNLTVTLVFTSGYLGLNQAITYHKSLKKYEDSHLWSFIMFFSIMWGTILGLVALVLTNYFVDTVLKLNKISSLFLQLGLLLMFIRLLNAYLRAYILGAKRFFAFNSLDIFTSVLNLTLLAVFIAVLDNNFTAIYVTWLLNPVIVGGVLFWTTRDRWARSEISIRKMFTENFRYGYKTYITNFMQLFNYRFDQYVLNYYRTPTEVGIYSVAVTVGGYLWELSNAVQTILFPSVPGLSDKQANRLISRANRNTLFLTFIGACMLGLTGFWLIKIVYGDAFTGAYDSLLWLLPGIVFYSVMKILVTSLAGLGHPEISSIVTACTMIITLVFDFAWVPEKGIVGAAQASSVAYASGGILSVVFYLRHMKASIKELFILQPEDIRSYLDALRRLIP